MKKSFTPKKIFQQGRLSFMFLAFYLILSVNLFSQTALTTFDPYYPTTFTMVSNTVYYPEPLLSRPATKSTGVAAPSYTDTNFGTLVYRVTDVADSPDPGMTMMRHEYSRKQAFNADNSKFIAMATNGFWYLYDAFTFAKLNGGRTVSPGLGALSTLGGDCEPTWHPTNPNKLWHTDMNGSLKFYEFDIITKTQTTLFDLTPLLAAIPGFSSATRAWWQGEGRPSDDGRWWGLSVQTSGFNQVGLICYDRQTNTIVGSVLTTNKPNNVSTSPSGAYVVPSWSNGLPLTLATASAQSINNTDGTRAYSQNFSTYTQLSYYGEHADVAKDVFGNDVYVSINYNSAKMPDVTDGHCYYRRMDNGVAVTLNVNTYDGAGAAVHVSGTADKKPGWVVIGNYQGGTTQRAQTIMVAELDPAPTRKLYRVAHHHSMVSSYFAEPHATVNHDFTSILFASDFGTTNKLESYMIGLPSFAFGTSTSVEESQIESDAKKVEVFPNPAGNFVNVYFKSSNETDNVYYFELRNLLGQVLISKTIESNRVEQINLSDIPNAIYIISIKQNNKLIDEKKFAVIN